ncbi:MAG: hypothetical protein ABI780_09360, partial [Ardenticatenales bacterium]
RSVHAAILAFALIAIPVAVPFDLRVTGASHANATVDAAASIAAPMTITLYSDTMVWWTEPWLFVTAYVTHVEGIRGDGRGGEVGRTGRAHGRADGSGQVVARLDDGGGRWQAFQPFDVLRLETATYTATVGAPLTVHVPELRVDVAADRTAVEGKSAPGARVAIALDAPPADVLAIGAPAPASTIVTAGADGRFRMPMADGVRVAPGQGGWATVVDGDGNAFRARFAAFALRLKLAQGTADGWLTPADELTVLDRRRRDNGGVYSHQLRGQTASQDGRRRFDDQPSDAAASGVPFTITIGSPVLGARTRTGLLPSPLSVDGAAPTGADGTAPPGAALTIEVFAADAGTDRAVGRDAVAVAPPIARIATMAGGDGRWHVDLPAATPLLAGGRVEAVLDLGDGLEAAAVGSRPRFTIAVEGARLAGDGLAPRGYALTARAPDGTALYTGTFSADADGRAVREVIPRLEYLSRDRRLQAIPPTVLMRGGALEVDDGGGGDPLRLAIPRLLARSDVDADSFSGTAPPGAALGVEVVGAFDTRRFTVRADPFGAWTLPLAGRIDIAVGVGARVWYTDTSGHRFYVDTAPVHIEAEPDRRHLDAGPTTGRAMQAEIVDPAGQLVATMAVPAFVGPDEASSIALTNTYGTWLVDRFGQEPAMHAGDTVRVRVGDDEAEWVLPPIEARLHPDLDLVVGRTAPGAQLEIYAGDIGDPLTVTATVTADADGYFRADLAGTIDVKWNGGVAIRGRFGPHTLLRYVAVPAITYNIDRAQVTGSLEPNVDVQATLSNGDTILARGHAMSDARAAFDIDLADAAGEPVIARAGMRLVIEAPAAQLYARMTLDVPDLTLVVADDGLSIGGARPPLAHLDVQASASQSWPFARQYPALETPMLDGVDRWRATLGAKAAPGISYLVIADLASGHRVTRDLVEPLFGFEADGSHLCGIVQPHSRVRLDLVAADGGASGGFAATASQNGVVDGAWTNANGRPSIAHAGASVVGTAGDQAITAAIEAMTATLELAGGGLRSRIRVRAPEGAYLFASAPARDCLYQLSVDEERWLSRTNVRLEAIQLGRSSPPVAGTYSGWLPEPALLARGLDLHMNRIGGHRTFRRLYHPLMLDADIATARLSGRTRPRADVRLALTAPDGVVRAAFDTRADASGAFDVPSRDAGGMSVAPRAGDRLTAVASVAPGADAVDIVGVGAETATMLVEDLDVDPSTSDIVGKAPAGRSVVLSLDIAGVGSRWIDLTADPDGRWRLGADDMPPRSGWTLDDVIGGRAELSQPDGHRTVASWSGAVRGAPLYLPWGGQRAITPFRRDDGA